MPTYAFETIDERGPEPLLRERLQVANKADLIPYRLTQHDVSRVTRFTLATVALRFTGNEDLDWVLRDVNDTNTILDDKELQVGDIIYIPRTWRTLASGERALATARTRVDRTVR